MRKNYVKRKNDIKARKSRKRKEKSQIRKKLNTLFEKSNFCPKIKF